MRDNSDFVVPVNILTLFARAPFSWATQHTTVCLDTGNWIACQVATGLGPACHVPILLL